MNGHTITNSGTPQGNQNNSQSNKVTESKHRHTDTYNHRLKGRRRHGKFVWSCVFCVTVWVCKPDDNRELLVLLIVSLWTPAAMACFLRNSIAAGELLDSSRKANCARTRLSRVFSGDTITIKKEINRTHTHTHPWKSYLNFAVMGQLVWQIQAVQAPL